MINSVTSGPTNTPVNTDPATQGTAATNQNQPAPTPLVEWPIGTPEPLQPFNNFNVSDDHPEAGVLQDDKTLRYPDGSTGSLGGREEHPVGTVYFKGGSYRLPDGVLHRSDGFTEYPNGNVQDPDGFIYLPEDNVTYIEDRTHIENGKGSLTYTKDLSGMIHIKDSDPELLDSTTTPPTYAQSHFTKLPFNAAGLEPDGRVRYHDGSIRDTGGRVQVGDILTHPDGRKENLTTGKVTDLEGNVTDRARFMVSSLGGGNFSINGQKVNIENLFLHIASELSLGVQADMKEKTEDLQIKNAAVAKLNEWMADLTTIRSNMEDDETKLVNRSNFKPHGIAIGGEMNEDGTINWNGERVDFGDPQHEGHDKYNFDLNGAQMDAYIQKIKGKIEELNSNSQLEMIDLQEMVSQNNRFYDMASNIISKAGNNRQTIAGNIRA